MYMYVYVYVLVYLYVCVHMYVYVYVHVYVYVYAYVYDISTILWLVFLTCTFSDFIWLVDFRYCMFLVLPFTP